MNSDREKKGKLNVEFYSSKDSYSDGDIEDDILNMVKNNFDSRQIILNDNRWPILYHFTHLRKNLLKWYDFKPQSKLLEIGAGCGALTELFCEKVKEVTAVELSKRRSEIIAHRCKAKKNLEIIVGNFNNIRINKKFDYITLIGVLEYAAIFTNSTNPYQDFLSLIKTYLKPDGILIIALENKFGLKYWAGAREDHTGGFFVGIENYLGDRGVRTFGKDELKELLHLAGFDSIDFYYPMPDYKIPIQVFSDDYLPEIGQIGGYFPNYDNDRLMLFNEKTTYDNIIKNNKFDFFANSFLLFCKKINIYHKNRVIYYKFINGRLPKFQVETSIFKENDITFSKKKGLTHKALNHIKNIYSNFIILQDNYDNIKVAKANLVKNEIIFEYIDGISFDRLLINTVFQRNKSEFWELTSKYIQLIKGLTSIKTGKFKASKKFLEVFGENFELDNVSYAKFTNIDLIFDNILINNKGEYTIIDYEWVFDFPIPLNYIFYRSFIYFFIKYREYLGNFLTQEEIFTFCKLNNEEIKAYEKFEMNFQNYVMSKNNIDNNYLKNKKRIKESSRLMLKEVLRRPRLLFEKGPVLQNIKNI